MYKKLIKNKLDFNNDILISEDTFNADNFDKENFKALKVFIEFGIVEDLDNSLEKDEARLYQDEEGSKADEEGSKTDVTKRTRRAKS